MFTPNNSLQLTCSTHIFHSPDNAGNKTVVTTNNNENETVVTSNVTTPKISKKTHGVLDSGATDHFLAIKSHVKNKQPAQKAINVEIPNGENMQSTKECDLDWPDLPTEAHTGYTFLNI